MTAGRRDDGPRPPRWLERLLSRLLPAAVSEEVLGDLGEEHAEIRRRRGAVAAWVWYTVQAAAIGGRYRLSGLSDAAGLGSDLRLGFRQMRRNPVFATVVVLALAVGVGANGMILSVVDSVFLDPLPYPDAGRLGLLTYSYSGSATDNFGISWLDHRDLREQSDQLEAVAGVIDWRHVDLTGEGDPERLPASFVGPGYLEILGRRPLLGRLFTAEENREGAAAGVALLSEGLWRRRFAGSAEVVGRVLTLNDVPVEVVGVLPEDGRGLRQRFDADAGVWLPLFAAEPLLDLDLDEERGAGPLNSLVRWRDGASLAAVRQELDAISARLQREHPASNEGWSFHVDPLEDVFFEELRAPTGVLAAGALLVFLLVAVNLTGLFLVRGTGRRREAAVRLALGAGRGRLLRQGLVESLVLGVLGTGAGLVFSAWGAWAVGATGFLELPGFVRPGLDARVVGPTLALALALTLLLGLVSGLSLGRSAGASTGPGPSGAGTRHPTGTGAQRTRTLLVAGEVCLAFLLLVGAGLMLRSFQTLRSTGYGFDTDRLLTLKLELRGEEYDEDRERIGLADELVGAARGLPGVESAFLWSPHSVGEGSWVDLLTREGRWDLHPAERLEASRHQVLPGTFERAGIRLLAGRDFRPSDDERAPPVAVVSRSLGERFWPGEDPVGRRIESRMGGDLTVREVVGVVEDVRHRSRLFDPFGPQLDVYYPFRQVTHGRMALALRWEPGASLAALTDAVRGRVRQIDPELPLWDLATMDERMRAEESRTRLAAILVALYSALAAALAGLGIYGVLSHAVHQQTREIGVRLALGATRRDVMGRVVRRGMTAMAAGAAVGLLLALAGGRVLAGALYGVEPRDPAALGAAVALVVVVSLLASVVPGRRAARVDPRDALVQE